MAIHLTQASKYYLYETNSWENFKWHERYGLIRGSLARLLIFQGVTQFGVN